MNATLLGADYDNRLKYLSMLLDLDVIEVPSGTELGTWTVPNEWTPKEAYVSFKGKKIIDLGMGNPDQPTPKHIIDELRPFGLKDVGVKIYGDQERREQLDLYESIKVNGGTKTED